MKNQSESGSVRALKRQIDAKIGNLYRLLNTTTSETNIRKPGDISYYDSKSHGTATSYPLLNNIRKATHHQQS